MIYVAFSYIYSLIETELALTWCGQIREKTMSGFWRGSFRRHGMATFIWGAIALAFYILISPQAHWNKFTRLMQGGTFLLFLMFLALGFAALIDTVVALYYLRKLHPLFKLDSLRMALYRGVTWKDLRYDVAMAGPALEARNQILKEAANFPKEEGTIRSFLENLQFEEAEDLLAQCQRQLKLAHTVQAAQKRAGDTLAAKRQARRLAEEGDFLAQAAELKIPESEIREALAQGREKALIKDAMAKAMLLRKARRLGCESVIVQMLDGEGVDAVQLILGRVDRIVTEAQRFGIIDTVRVKVAEGSFSAAEILISESKTAMERTKLMDGYRAQINQILPARRPEATAKLRELEGLEYKSRAFRSQKHALDVYLGNV